MIIFGPSLSKNSKCHRAGCENDATRTDYRPSYIDEDGDGECIGKTLTCDDCFNLNNKDWLSLGKDGKMKIVSFEVGTHDGLPENCGCSKCKAEREK